METKTRHWGRLCIETGSENQYWAINQFVPHHNCWHDRNEKVREVKQTSSLWRLQGVNIRGQTQTSLSTAGVPDEWTSPCRVKGFAYQHSPALKLRWQRSGRGGLPLGQDMVPAVAKFKLTNKLRTTATYYVFQSAWPIVFAHISEVTIHISMIY